MSADTEGAIRGAAARMGGEAFWPSTAGEPVFGEPWEGRAFALAFDVVGRSGLAWEVFRQRLIEAIGEEPHRPYYASWVVALERLVLDETAVDRDDLERERGHAASYRYEEAGVGDIEVFPVSADEVTVRDVLSGLLDTWGRQIRFAVPFRVMDELLLRCRHAEFYRVWSQGAPTRWGFRTFDVDDHRQLDVVFPTPFFDDDERPLPEPDWSRLECWDALRREHLHLAGDPADRLGPVLRDR